MNSLTVCNKENTDLTDTKNSFQINSFIGGTE